MVRLNASSFDGFHSRLPVDSKRWIDAGTEGLGQANPEAQWLQDFFAQFQAAKQLSEPQFQLSPDKNVVTTFVEDVLTFCQAKSPDWISVPQLPYADNAARNRINKRLAIATREWRQKTGGSAGFILPVILSHQRQTNTKALRNRKVQLAAECYEQSGAEGYWVVDHSLNDVEGSPAFDKRVAGLVSFQKELEARIGRRARLRVVGPYWGLGLLLWTKGLAEYLGVGLGSAYTYYLAGGHRKTGRKRVSLPGLCRLATASKELEAWITQAVEGMPLGSIRTEFIVVAQRMSSYLIDDPGRRRQVAKFHRGWYDAIAKVPEAGRPLALYQILSSAYVLGKTLDRLPANEVARRPESVARLLMLHCL